MDVARLAKKLNLKSPRNALVLDAPDAFAPMIVFLRDDLGVSVDTEAGVDSYDYVHAFVETEAQAHELLPGAAAALAAEGLLWVSYPKRSSKRYASDVARDSDAWAPLYARNLEPVRQVSVDDDWSALRFRPVEAIERFTRRFAGSEAGTRRIEEEGPREARERSVFMASPCELVDQQARPTLVVRTRAAVERLPEVLGPAWGSILACAGRAGAQPASRPFVAYHNMDMQDLDLEIGFAFDRALEGEGEVRASEIPAGKAVETVHVGPYDEIGSAYEAVQAWMSVQGLLPAGPSYEYYLNDPAEVAPEELRTRIVVPVG